jgi:ornithine cyclodeaminase/alanine dehydrogenase-like protein (mu-crystallin family)
VERANVLAASLHAELGIPVAALSTAQQAVKNADIICTVTAASEPILKSEWVQPGTHINAVGSSHAGPAEIDNALVARARFFADSREGVLQQGAEFLRAKRAGLIDNAHILAEIGQVFAGTAEGRRSSDEITIYKSLGHVVQDLASAWWLYSQPDPRA